MNGDLKTVLRVLFIVALIWALAALVGLAPGAEIRIGAKGSGKRRRGCSVNPFRWVSNGMVGELVQSPGYNPPAVGWPGTVF
jgi:hypothetical protein